jgi:hypothetical protein
MLTFLVKVNVKRRNGEKIEEIFGKIGEFLERKVRVK